MVKFVVETSLTLSSSRQRNNDKFSHALTILYIDVYNKIVYVKVTIYTFYCYIISIFESK